MKIVFSGALLRFVDYSKEVDVPGNTLAECLQQLTTKFPALQPVLLDGASGVRRTHQLFLNGDQVAPNRYAAGAPALAVGDDDTLFVLTAVAGG
jgi:molybdopterin converting factor small subunit